MIDDAVITYYAMIIQANYHAPEDDTLENLVRCAVAGDALIDAQDYLGQDAFEVWCDALPIRPTIRAKLMQAATEFRTSDVTAS